MRYFHHGGFAGRAASLKRVLFARARREFIEICCRVGRLQIFRQIDARDRGQKRNSSAISQAMAHRLAVFYTRVHVRGIAARAPMHDR